MTTNSNLKNHSTSPRVGLEGSAPFQVAGQRFGLRACGRGSKEKFIPKRIARHLTTEQG